jgi:predicted nucleic acid-binding protein
VKVFCNTTPLIALASIDRLELLHQVLGDISVAEAVVEEWALGGPMPVPALRTLPCATVYPDLSPNEWLTVLDLDRGEQQTLPLARPTS